MPDSSASMMSSPVPSVVVTRASRSAGASSVSPEARAISTMPPPDQLAHWAWSGRPSASCAQAVCQAPPRASTSASAVPGPPSASGTTRTSASGHPARTPASIARAACPAVRLPLNSSGATRMRTVTAWRPGRVGGGGGCATRSAGSESSTQRGTGPRMSQCRLDPQPGPHGFCSQKPVSGLHTWLTPSQTAKQPPSGAADDGADHPVDREGDRPAFLPGTATSARHQAGGEAAAHRSASSSHALRGRGPGSSGRSERAIASSLRCWRIHLLRRLAPRARGAMAEVGPAAEGARCVGRAATAVGVEEPAAPVGPARRELRAGCGGAPPTPRPRATARVRAPRAGSTPRSPGSGSRTRPHPPAGTGPRGRAAAVRSACARRARSGDHAGSGATGALRLTAVLRRSRTVPRRRAPTGTGPGAPSPRDRSSPRVRTSRESRCRSCIPPGSSRPPPACRRASRIRRRRVRATTPPSSSSANGPPRPGRSGDCLLLSRDAVHGSGLGTHLQQRVGQWAHTEPPTTGATAGASSSLHHAKHVELEVAGLPQRGQDRVVASGAPALDDLNPPSCVRCRGRRASPRSAPRPRGRCSSRSSGCLPGRAAGAPGG